MIILRMKENNVETDEVTPPVPDENDSEDDELKGKIEYDYAFRT